jgi:hypothetical protein
VKLPSERRPAQRWALVFLCLAAAASTAGGCASSPKIRTTSPFTDRDAEVFDGSVDFVADPRALQGRWEEEYVADMQHRVGRLDLLAVVEIDTIRNDLTPEGRSQYRLFAKIDRVLFEADDFDVDELELNVRDGEPGYPTVADNQRRILNEPFIAFVKFAPPEVSGEAPVPRWHLSPVSEPILEEIRALLQERDPGAMKDTGSRRVFVHDDE